MDFFEGLLVLFFFKIHQSLYGNFYASFTEFIIFGLIFSLITIELFRKYNPKDTSREIAKNYDGHIIIIGYTNIGKRLVDYFKKHEVKHVIVEEDYTLVEDLISNEEAVVNDSPLSLDTLKDAGINKAKAVYVTTPGIEVQMVVSAHVRQFNTHCRLINRIYEDDIAEVIAKTYNAIIISTSKYASNVILNKIIKNNYKNILLIGANHISSRLINKFKKKGNIKYQLIEENEDLIEDLLIDDKSYIIHGDPKDMSILRNINVEDIDCVVNINPDVTSNVLITKRIRDLNRDCKIIGRFFLESVAEILEKAPFRAEVISSSKYTLEIMIQNGMLDF